MILSFFLFFWKKRTDKRVSVLDLFIFKFTFIWLSEVLIVSCGIFPCGMQAPEHIGSLVEARGLCHSGAHA